MRKLPEYECSIPNCRKTARCMARSMADHRRQVRVAQTTPTGDPPMTPSKNLISIKAAALRAEAARLVQESDACALRYWSNLDVESIEPGYVKDSWLVRFADSTERVVMM